MPTPAEQKALLFLGAVALLGGAVRIFGGGEVAADATAAERAGLAAQIVAAESAAAADRAERSGGKARGPKARRKRRATGGEGAGNPEQQAGTEVEADRRSLRGPVDVDRATVEELDALPGIGPSLARRIVADRNANGAYGSLAALDGVSGIGPTLINRLAPLVTFSGPRRPTSGNGSGGGARSSGRVVGLIGGRP